MLIWPMEDFRHASFPAVRASDRLQHADMDRAANVWANALGRAVDPIILALAATTACCKQIADEPIVQLQRVEHEARVTLISTDDIPAEVARLEAWVPSWLIA